MRCGGLGCVRLLVGWLVAGSVAAAGQAGHRRVDSELSSLHEDGSLVVWVVLPVASARAGVTGPLAFQQYNEQSVGTFGQAASTAGKNAGDTGTAPSKMGRNASDSGQSASSVGQTAGSFGESVSTIAAAASAANGSVGNPNLVHGDVVAHDASWDQFENRVKDAFPELRVVFVDVGADDLHHKLIEANTSPESPDVVVGMPLRWGLTSPEPGLAASYVVVSRVSPVLDQLDRDDAPVESFVEGAVLLRSHHPQTGRAFYVWLREHGQCVVCGEVKGTAAPVAVAVRFLRRALTGQPIMDDADIDAAFGAGLARTLNPAPSRIPRPSVRRRSGDPMLPLPMPVVPEVLSEANDPRLRLEVMSAQANDYFAVVGVRAIADLGLEFTVRHALLVLRKDEDGDWKVLQITPDLPVEQLGTAFGMLQRYAHEADDVADVKGISEASPRDGDNRSPQPFLWWDNLGGATLQVVEWQDGGGGASNLYFVPDVDFRLKTQAKARFAKYQVPSAYRWRVWSLGDGGVVVLSPWRRLNILPN